MYNVHPQNTLVIHFKISYTYKPRLSLPLLKLKTGTPNSSKAANKDARLVALVLKQWD